MELTFYLFLLCVPNHLHMKQVCAKLAASLVHGSVIFNSYYPYENGDGEFMQVVLGGVWVGEECGRDN